MTKIHKSALVAYSAEQMFDLVNHIEAYPEFLPWCSKTQVLKTDENYMIASISIAKGPIQSSFTTENKLHRQASPLKIELNLKEGPFKDLSGYWQFIPLKETATKVTLDLEFEFSNSLMKMTLGPVFEQIAAGLVEAFCKRAKDIYD